MGGEFSIASVAEVVRVAVAPVFLLTGIGAILGVLVNRLGRVTDRFRRLEIIITGSKGSDQSDNSLHEVEIRTLRKRAKYINRAIVLCSSSALMICMVIVALFVGSILEAGFPTTISILFICSMLFLILGLTSFIQEVALAINNMLISTLS